MLKSLELENFRAFSKKIRVEFKPITVLIGKNSAGKSSLLRWLHMARQSARLPQRDQFLVCTTPQGEYAAWPELRNRSVSALSHHYALEFSTEILSRDLAAIRDPEGAPVAGRHEVEEGAPSVNYQVGGRITYRKQQDFGEYTISMTHGDAPPLFRRKVNSLKGSSFLYPPATPGQDYLRAITLDGVCLKPARDYLGAIAHVGAVRRESRGVIDLRTPPSGDVGHEGEFAHQHLVEIFQGDGERQKSQRDFILRHAANVLGVEGIRVRKIGDGLTSRPEGKNTLTEVTHRLTEFGFGVSQAVPLFVQGVIVDRGGCFAIEQPEAQLHPTAQLEMGTFFAELWSQRGVGSIIETHSSNILLRLRRHVRAGELNPGDLSVAYFHVEKGVTKVTNMGVKADGELDGHLPMEFFGADLFEALEFNAIQRRSKT